VKPGPGAALLALALTGCFWPFRAHPLDVNSAPATDLARLPGLTQDDAARIVASRPYYAKEDLRSRGVLSADQYRALENDIVVGKPGVPDYLQWVPPE